ncbi:MAG: hypothetical protein K1X88_05270 [Nannocystaceae bacterium]|nr:hypothetical protein [Nannocystaceae bacterium]
MDLCRHLRWKTFSREQGDPAAVAESLRRGQVPFSCLRTCQAWGPDDDVVAPERCCAERGCYEPDRVVADVT